MSSTSPLDIELGHDKQSLVGGQASTSKVSMGSRGKGDFGGVAWDLALLDLDIVEHVA